MSAPFLANEKTARCDAKTEVYARVCGFFRPVQQWNRGKKEEYKDRVEYVIAATPKGEPPDTGGGAGGSVGQ